MTVLKFPPSPEPTAGEWHADEMRQVLALGGAYVAGGEASGWHFGATDTGDPQAYLLGPAPDYDCILSISRLGRLYVLEDGQGHLLNEHNSLLVLAEQARTHLRRQKAGIVARVAVAWYALREMFEEKLEPILAEPAEFFAHVAPKLAALA